MKFVKIFAIAAKSGTVTKRYPFEAPLVTESFRGAIEIDPSKCVGCGACTRICPPKALTLEAEGGKLVLRYFVGRCIFCWMCVDVCPEKAITGTRNFELAAESIENLYSDVVHKLAVCRKCGKPFISAKQLDKVKKRIDASTELGEALDLCPECRRKETLAKIAVPLGVAP